MKRSVFMMVALALMATICSADTGRMIVEPTGNQRVNVFAPDYQYDLLLTLVVTPVPVSGFLFTSMVSSAACKVWKADTNSRVGHVAIPIAANTPFTRGINPTSAFFIYSGCVGPVERQ